jgi:hypothetical protein
MRLLRVFLFRLAGLFGLVRRDTDIAEELATHRQAMEAEFRHAGMSDDEARRAAALRFGSMASAAQAYREARGFIFIETLARDVNGYELAGDDRNGTSIYLPLPTLDAARALIVRVYGDPELVRRSLVDRLSRVAPTLPMVVKLQTLGTLATYPLRIAFWVAVVLGGLALALTLSGIYGVMSYLVVQRTKEVGVRIALGATTGAITRLVLWQSLRLVAIGLTIGASFALILSKFLVSTPAGEQLLRVIDPLDSVAYMASLSSIVIACVAAAVVPAFRAARIDPVATLRHD